MKRLNATRKWRKLTLPFPRELGERDLVGLAGAEQGDRVDGAIDNLQATLGLTTLSQRDPTSSNCRGKENTTVWPYLRHDDDAIAAARFHRMLSDLGVTRARSRPSLARIPKSGKDEGGGQ